MNVGFYPIKEVEMKQIIRMNLSYLKKDMQSIDTILEQNRVDSKTKEFVYTSLRECLNNRKAPYFNTSFGVCIAKIQKIYRNNYIFNDKSFTKLMNSYPMLKSYNTSLGEVIKFKNNKYMYKDQLESENSSGVYISYENAKRLYNDYYLNINVKKYLDSYFGNDSYGNNKFIKVLDYCIQNQCGLLEADIPTGVQNNHTQIQSKSTTNQVIENNGTVVNVEAVPNAKTATVAKETWKIIGFRLLMGLAGIGMSFLISYIVSICLLQFLRSYDLLKWLESIDYSISESYDIILCVTTMISYIIEVVSFIAISFIFKYILFNKITQYASRHDQIEDSQKHKFIICMAIFFGIMACGGIAISALYFGNQISAINQSIKYVKKSIFYSKTDSIVSYYIFTEIIAIICLIIEIITVLFINIKSFLNIKNNRLKAKNR